MYHTNSDEFSRIERTLDSGGNVTLEDVAIAIGDEAFDLAMHFDSICRDWATNGLREKVIRTALLGIGSIATLGTIDGDTDEAIATLAMRRFLDRADDLKAALRNGDKDGNA